MFKKSLFWLERKINFVGSWEKSSDLASGSFPKIYPLKMSR
jgi:hypothetical protein